MSTSDSASIHQAGVPRNAYWTAKNLNATAASRTATTRPIRRGMVLHQDPHAHDGRESGGTVAPLNVFMIAAAGERVYNAYKVVDFDPRVNDVVDGALRGGFITVVAWDEGRDTTLVNGSVAVGNKLVTQLTSSATTGGALIAATAISTAAEISSFCGTALAANSSGDAQVRVAFNGLRN